MCTGAEIAAAAGAVQAGGQVMGGFDALRQSTQIGQQISNNAQENLRDTARAQKTRRGAMRSAYAKAGVKQSGTVKLALDEQILQDEMALDTIATDALLNIKKTSRAGRRSLYKGIIGGGGTAAATYVNSPWGRNG